VIIHPAAIIPPQIHCDPVQAGKVNVDASATLVRAAEAQPRPPRFVHASTCSLYGPRNPHHQTELLCADTPARPFEHYGRQKQEAEEIVRSSNLAWVVLRLGSVDPAAMPFSASETDEIQRHLG